MMVGRYYEFWEEEEKRQYEVAVQEVKKINPDLIWNYPEVNDEWKTKIINFIKTCKIENTPEEIEAIFRIPVEDPYFPYGFSKATELLSEINKHEYMDRSLWADTLEWLEEEIDSYIYKKNEVLDNPVFYHAMCDCYYDITEIGFDFDRDGFSGDVLSLVTPDELHEAILCAKNK